MIPDWRVVADATWNLALIVMVVCVGACVAATFVRYAWEELRRLRRGGL